MQRQDYTEQLLEHYESPRYYGALPAADVVVQGENPGCGDFVTIYLKTNTNGTVEAVQFEGEGCTISLAATSMLMEMVHGKTLAQIQAIDYNALIEQLGREIVLTRVRCATLGLKTLKEAIRQHYAKQIEVS
jgi:nitrogen fixation NifU-like protein